MKFAYLILSYKNFEQLKNFISSVEGKDVRIYIHIDKKVRVDDELKSQIEGIGENITFEDDRISVFWGGFSLVDAMIKLMRRYLADDFGADYIHICTDSDRLIRPRSEMESFLKQQGSNRNYLTYYTLPNDMWRDGGMNRFTYKWSYDYRSKFMAMLSVKIQKVCGFKRRLPESVDLYGGSSWMSLTHEAIAYVSERSIESDEIFRFFRYVAIPDESYIHTQLMNSQFKDSVECNNLRFIKWVGVTPHPATLTDADYDEWIASEQFFARKFTPTPLAPKSIYERFWTLRSRFGNYFFRWVR